MTGRFLAATVAFLASALCFAQHHSASQNVFIDLPQGIHSEDVFIRYKIIPEGGGGHGGLVESKRGLGQYAVPVTLPFAGKPQFANIIVYAPGCEFKIYLLDVTGQSDLKQAFKCDPLPTRRILAKISPSEIPKNFIQKVDRLEIRAGLDANWTCDYLLRRRPDDKNSMMGSCLGASIPLGPVGVLDPANGGSFEIDIPDFSRDPTFQEFGTERYGQIFLVLDDRFGRRRAVLSRQGGTAPLDLGLKITKIYSEPVVFTTTKGK